MKAGIYTNLKKDPDLAVTSKLIELLSQNGFDLVLHADIQSVCPSCKTFTSDSSLIADVMFVLGGDGTILKIAKLCAIRQIPVLGVNIGTIGFLSEILPSEMQKVISKLKLGEFSIEKRSMITTVIDENPVLALNDIVVSRAGNGKLALIDLYIDGQVVDRYHCDGFIVSTPTGSTAYSLSAGGAIVSPCANVLALTPINSHTLHARPLVVGEKERVVLSVNKDTPVSVIADGKVVKDSIFGAVEIAKSDLFVTFIRFNHQNFYNRLLSKLNKWSVVDVEELL